jgi:hypothetical protein
MALEDRFENISLNKKEFNRLKRNALNYQYDSKKPFIQGKMPEYPNSKYDIIAVRELFNGTSVSEEIISKELFKIQEERERKKQTKFEIKQSLKKAIRPILLSLAITSAVIGVGYGAVRGVSAIGKKIVIGKQKIEFNKLYNPLLEKYGDVDKDGEVSDYENLIFKENIMKEHNTQYQFGNFMMGTKDKIGKEIPIPTLTQWLREYKQKKDLNNGEIGLTQEELEFKELDKFREIYDPLLEKYGDRDKDGKVSDYEELIFKEHVMKEHDTQYQFGDKMMETKDKEGKILPISTLIQWLREYEQKKNPNRQ